MRNEHLMVLACAIGCCMALGGCGDSAGKPAAPAEPSAPLLSSHGGNELQWELDWQRAMQRASAESKLVMVNFSADWCIWCKRYDSTTFADSEVRRMLTQQVIPLRLIIDGNGAERAREMGVDAPPTLVFIDPASGEKGRILGYMPPTHFMQEMQRILPQEG